MYPGSLPAPGCRTTESDGRLSARPDRCHSMGTGNSLPPHRRACRPRRSVGSGNIRSAPPLGCSGALRSPEQHCSHASRQVRQFAVCSCPRRPHFIAAAAAVQTGSISIAHASASSNGRRCKVKPANLVQPRLFEIHDTHRHLHNQTCCWSIRLAPCGCVLYRLISLSLPSTVARRYTGQASLQCCFFFLSVCMQVRMCVCFVTALRREAPGRGRGWLSSH